MDEYLIDLNATRAYKAVYKNVKSDDAARASSSKLLTNPNIKEHLDKRMKEREIRTEITQDRVLKELARVAFANGSDFAKVVEKSYTQPIFDKNTGEQVDEKEVFYKTVEVEETNKLPKDKLAAISGIKQTKEGIEIKSADKVKALELLGKHLGMFTDKLEHSGTINNPFANLSEEDLLKIVEKEQ